MARTLIVDPSCIGCNICVSRACHTFALYETDDDFKEIKSKVIDQNGDSAEDIENAIVECPVNAISWQDI